MKPSSSKISYSTTQLVQLKTKPKKKKTTRDQLVVKFSSFASRLSPNHQKNLLVREPESFEAIRKSVSLSYAVHENSTDNSNTLQKDIEKTSFIKQPSERKILEQCGVKYDSPPLEKTIGENHDWDWQLNWGLLGFWSEKTAGTVFMFL